MPKVRFDDGTVINFDSMPSQQDIEEAYSQAKGGGVATQTQPQASPISALVNSINTAPQRTEEKIAQRPSAMADLIQDPSTLERFKQHPLGTALRTFGGAYEMAEGIPADVALKLNKPKEILPDIYKTIMGQRPAQFGDVLRKGGAPEPVAAVGGLLASGIPGTPTAGLGAVAEKAVSPATKTISLLAKKFGKPALAQTIRFMTGTVPKVHAERVLENPNILSPKILAQEGKEASRLYQTVIQPLRNNQNAVVDLAPVQAKILQEGLTTPYGEPSPEMSKLSKTEFGKIKDWTNKLDIFVKGKVATTFNRVEGWINEIDSSLGKFYKGKEKTLLTGREAISEPFQRLASILRSGLSDALKTQFPDAAPVIERYHNFSLDRAAAESFKGLNASFFKGLPTKMAILSMGVPTRGAAIPAYLGTMPAFWKKAILGGAKAGGVIEKHPEYLLPTLRGSLKKNED